MKNITIFTDGSSLGNPGPGGWGAVIFFSDGKLCELGGTEENTTNNKMELTAIERAMMEVADESGDVDLFSDSKYAINGITKWSVNWQKNNWKTKNKEPVTNQEVWKNILEAKKGIEKNERTISFTYVPGHADHDGNERADTIARSLAEGKDVELFQGELKDSMFAESDLSVNEAMLKEKKTKKTGKAYSYVSFVDGEIMTHQTWDECKARVHGASGAKFKKAISKENEAEIIKNFTS